MDVGHVPHLCSFAPGETPKGLKPRPKGGVSILVNRVHEGAGMIRIDVRQDPVP
jgi:hypothetical protein